MSHYVVPVKTYFLVFTALLVLLGLTVAAAQIEHGALNLVVALSIAFSKAALIVLFFMHLRYNPFVVRMAAMAGFLWLAILITLTMSDYLTRSEQAPSTPTSQIRLEPHGFHLTGTLRTTFNIQKPPPRAW